MEDLREVIEDFKTGIAEEGLNAEDYCLVLYTTSGQFGSVRRLHRVYKTMEDFEAKVEKDAEGVDDMFGIATEIWIYD